MIDPIGKNFWEDKHLIKENLWLTGSDFNGILNFHKIDCDYLVGAQLEGFDTMVKLTKEAKIAVIEGDEYLSSPIDRRPKFHLYKPNIAILSGIAWDHINVFPTFDFYVEQFQIFVNQLGVLNCNRYGSIIRKCKISKESLLR